MAASDVKVVVIVRELKQQPAHELQVHGSARPGRSLLHAGLVDELRLVVAPVVVGAGRRLFDRSEQPVGLSLAASTSTPGGLALHTYVAAANAAFDTYDPAVHTFRSPTD